MRAAQLTAGAQPPFEQPAPSHAPTPAPCCCCLCCCRAVAQPWPLPALSTAPRRLVLPPLPPGAPFSSAYQVVMLLDQREQYCRAGPGGKTLGRTGGQGAQRLRGHAPAHACSALPSCSCVHLPRPLAGPPAPGSESLARYVSSLDGSGVAVDARVTLPVGDVLWVAQHKTSRQR